MKDFAQWYSELISDDLWFQLLRHYKDETIKKAAERVYASLVADGSVNYRPMQENRKHVYNIVVKNPGDKPKGKPWHQVAAEKLEAEKQEEWKPASPEHVDKCVAEFDEMMRNSSMINSTPRIGYAQSVEEGGWLPKKGAPYPAATPEEVYVRMRHLEYIKANYEPRTGEKLPTWISEDEFNILYDSNLT